MDSLKTRKNFLNQLLHLDLPDELKGESASQKVRKNAGSESSALKRDDIFIKAMEMGIDPATMDYSQLRDFILKKESG